MAQRALHPLRRPGLSYRRIVVPLDEESETAMALAVELADEHETSIYGVAAIELPPQLPLEAHMLEEEAQARKLAEEAQAIAAARGVRIRTRIVRTRESGEAIVAAAEDVDADLVIVHTPRTKRLDRTARHVLHRAPCRVLLAAPSL